MATSINRNEYKVSEFLTWRAADGLDLSPNFQRRSVWRRGAKSYLIDTILRDMPMPPVFLRDLPTDVRTFAARREVVDGQQRLRTVFAYVRPDLLPDFNPAVDDFAIMRTHDRRYAGAKFSQLPRDARNQILDYRIVTHTFPPSTADRQILQIFARMNATGCRLNPQELRNAEYYGEFKTVAYDLALEQLNRWRKWHIFTEYNIARMDEVELTSELMILMLKGISQKSASSITAGYKTYDAEFPRSAELVRRFQAVFDSVEDGFPVDAMAVFAKKTIFYCLFGAVYHCLYGLGSELRRSKKKALRSREARAIISNGSLLAKGRAPKRVFDATQRRTSHASSRRLVTSFLLKDIKRP